MTNIAQNNLEPFFLLNYIAENHIPRPASSSSEVAISAECDDLRDCCILGRFFEM